MSRRHSLNHDCKQDIPACRLDGLVLRLNSPPMAGRHHNQTNNMEPKTPVSETKQFRKDLDAVLQDLKLSSIATGPTPCRASRERSLAITKIQEAIMWLGMDLKAINEESPSDETANPYPQSYNPESPVIEPTADGLKL